jgi:hypothetical protein
MFAEICAATRQTKVLLQLGILLTQYVQESGRGTCVMHASGAFFLLGSIPSEEKNADIINLRLAY